MTAIQVFLDDASTRCGTLYANARRDRVSSTFTYANDYLNRPRAYAVPAKEISAFEPIFGRTVS